MQLQPVLRQLTRWGWLIVLCAILSGLAGLFVSQQLTPVYRATTTLAPAGAPRLPGAESMSSDLLVTTYVQLLERRPVLEAIIGRLGLRVGAEQLAGRLAVAPVDGTLLFTISAEAPSAAEAAMLANTAAEVLRIEGPRMLGYGWSQVRLTVVEAATPPAQPIFPRTALNVAIATVLGALLSAGVIALRSALLSPVETPDDLWGGAGLATLAAIPPFRPAAGSAAAIAAAPTRVTDAFRQLRAGLISHRRSDAPAALAVTSPAFGDGKSTVAAHLAVSVAQSGRRVILVDANLRRPVIHERLGLRNERGLTTALRRGVGPVEEHLAVTDEPNLRVLMAGPAAAAGVELLASRELEQLLAGLRAEADLLIVDCGPALDVADGIDVVRHCDVAILVATAGASRAGDLAQARERIEHAGVPVLGGVIRGRTLWGRAAPTVARPAPGQQPVAPGDSRQRSAGD